MTTIKRDFTVEELRAAKELVDSQLINRPFAEHPEDRIELIHKQQFLEQRIQAALITHLPYHRVEW